MISNQLNVTGNISKTKKNFPVLKSRINEEVPENTKTLEQSERNFADKKKNIKKAELRFTKIIIFSSVIFIIVRFFDLAQTIIYRSKLLSLIDFDDYVLRLIRSINIIIIYLSYSADFFIYLYFDRNFGNILTGYILQPLKLFFD